MTTTATMTTSTTVRPKLPVAVEKPTPYTFDLGLLLANDANPATVPARAGEDKDDDAREAALAELARDGAQALVNQLLTACPIEKAPAGEGRQMLLQLPPAQTALPREKPVPAAKPPTKWQQFAARKGIAPKTREQRRNLQYNAATGAWERRWGHAAAANRSAAETDWVVEVKDSDAGRARDRAHAEQGTSYRGDGRRERKEHARRNERRMRRNQERAARAG